MCNGDGRPMATGQKPPTVPPVAAPENDEPHKNVLSMSIKIHFSWTEVASFPFKCHLNKFKIYTYRNFFFLLRYSLTLMVLGPDKIDKWAHLLTCPPQEFIYLICQINEALVFAKKWVVFYSPMSKAAIAGVLSIKQPLAMINAKRLRFQLPFQLLVGLAKCRTRLWLGVDDDERG